MAPNNEPALERLRSALLTDFDAKTLEGLFAVISEDVLDALDEVDSEHLANAWQELRRSYVLLTAQDPEAEDTAAFVLGRVTGLLELVGAAVERQEPAKLRREMANGNSREVLDLLRRGEKTSKEIEEALGIDKALLSKQLQRLEAVGLIIRQKSGRDTYSRLSLAVRTARNEDLRDGRSPGFGYFKHEDIAKLFATG